MSIYASQAAARLRRHPVHTLLAPIPFVCFLGTLFTDVVYWRTADMQWANFSVWMLVAGLVVSVLVVLAGLVDFLADPGLRAQRAAWVHGAGDAVALVLAILNAFIHSRDAYTSVVPWGLFLSAVVVVILVAVGRNDRGLVYRAGSGPTAEDRP